MICEEYFKYLYDERRDKLQENGHGNIMNPFIIDDLWHALDKLRTWQPYNPGPFNPLGPRNLEP